MKDDRLIFSCYIASLIAMILFAIITLLAAINIPDWKDLRVLIPFTLTALSVCAFKGFIRIGIKEMALTDFMSKPIDMIESGLRYIAWPFMGINLFTLGLIELEFRAATIITKKDGECCAAKIKAKATMYFQWPREKEGLILALQAISDPLDIEAIKNMFEEAVLEAVRTVGGNNTWLTLTQDRAEFAREVLEQLRNEPNDPIKLAGLKDVKIVIEDVELPIELSNAISAPQVAKLNAQATAETAKGERQKLLMIGDAKAKSRRMLLNAIGGDKDEAYRWQVLDTLKEMAQGTSNTLMVLPLQVMDALNSISQKFGSNNALETLRSIFPELTDEMAQKIIDMAKSSKKK